MKKLLRSLLAVMLIAMMAVSFTSCGVAKNPDKAEKKLDKAGYEVMVIDDEASLNYFAKMYDLEDGDIECIVRATKGDDEYVQIIYCANAKAAKAIYKEIKKEMKEYKEEIKDLEGDEKKEAKEALKDMKYGKSGKVVYSGSKKGVKAA